MFPQTTLPTEHIKLGNHLCFIYDTPQEQQALIVPFIKRGLKNNCKCIYILDESTSASIMRALENAGVKVDYWMRRGQLQFASKEDTYLRMGMFDPDAMISLLKEEANKALREGYLGLYATGEMTWFFQDAPGTERLLEYEAKLNYFLPNSSIAAICQYNRRRFDEEFLLEVVKTHPFVAVGDTICSNFYFVPPDIYLSGQTTAGQLDWHIANMKARERAEYGEVERNRELSLLNEIATTLSQPHQKDIILGNLLGKSMALIGADCGAIYLHSDSAWTLVVHQGFSAQHVKQACVNLQESAWFQELLADQEVIVRKERLEDDDGLIGKEGKADKIQSFSAVPCYSKGKILGIMVLASPEYNQFSQETVRLLPAIGHQVGMVVENLELFERERREKERLAALNEAGSALIRPTRLARRTKAVLNGLKKLGFDQGWLAVVSADGKSVERIGGFGYKRLGKKAVSALPITARKDAAVNCLNKKTPLRIDDWDPTAKDAVCVNFFAHDPPDHFVLLPIVIEAERMGILGIGNRGYQRQITDHEMALLETFALQAGLAIKNAQLIASLEERINERTAQLRQSEKKYRELLESIDDIVFDCDLEGKLTFVNLAVKQVLGYSPSKIIGHRLTEFVHPDDLKRTLQERQEALKGRGAHQLESRWTHKNGGIVHLSIRYRTTLDKNGQPIGTRGTARNITQSKKLEQQLIQSERLAATGTLAASIAHEINNPLAGIKMAVEQLSKHVHDDEDTSHLADLSLKEIERISDLIKSMQDFHRPSDETMMEIDIHSLIKDTLSMTRAQLKMLGIKAKTHLSSDIPLILASGNQLQQVFINLMNNAEEAMPGGGRLDLRTWQDNEKIFISFADTGCGIPPENLDKVFDAFFTTKREASGVGLGLSVSYGIVKRHGGTIEVESEIDKGTCFTITLPIQ